MTGRAGAVPAALLLALLAAAPARGADAPKAPWEAEVEQQSAEQTALIERARARRAMASVVNAYASRLTRDPSPLTHYLYGRALYYNGDPAGARAQMQLALDANPGFYPARLRMALLLIELRNFADADRQLAAVLAARPEDAEALELSARSAVEQRDWQRAIGLLSRRIDSDPAEPRWRRLLAQIHMQRHDWEAARREWTLLRQRDPASVECRYALAVCRLELGEVDAAVADLEALAKEEPGRLEVLDRLRSAYVRKKDWEKVRATLERMAPYLPEDRRKEALAMVEELRKAPPEAGGGEAPAPSWEQLTASAAQDPDAGRRERALRALYEGLELGYVKRLPAVRLQRAVRPDLEPDATCRSWIVRILGEVSPTVVPAVSLALYDPDTTVRAVAAEVLGRMGEPAAVLYLLPFTQTDGLDLVEYESVRAALGSLTGFQDLPPGRTSVASREELAASREAWRRWSLSEESVPVLLAAVRRLVELREAAPERFLYDLVESPRFEVMRAAYLEMRKAVAREPRDPVERKVFPHFPSVPDEEVTRASMRDVQERVRAWWDEWVAERRALQRAKGDGGR